MATKMRILYVTCALLAIAIGGFATPVTTTNNDKSNDQQKTLANSPAPVLTANASADTTTAVPGVPVSHIPTEAPLVANGTTANPNSTSTTLPVTTAEPTKTTAEPTNPTTKPTSVTTPATTISTPTQTTVTSKTTVVPTIPTKAPTVLPTTANNTPTAVPSTPTTAVPSPTMLPPPSSTPDKERHFDGLSFIGGMTLAVCLMGIAVFSWRFYRTCNDRNYRTL